MIPSEGRWESCLSLGRYAWAEGEEELALIAVSRAGSGTHIYHSSWWAVWRNVRHSALCLHSLTNDLLFASILCLCCSLTMLLFNFFGLQASLTCRRVSLLSFAQKHGITWEGCCCSTCWILLNIFKGQVVYSRSGQFYGFFLFYAFSFLYRSWNLDFYA